ncbi:MAG: universal stress protein [Candidatus Latescibacter sp.]|nr:universal stress protein [Candidatus Latescibacter sp.]
MYHCILVPLDGSRLAESALPAAAFMAGIFGAEVTLIHVIERNAPQEIHGDRHLTGTNEAAAYMEELKKRAFPPGIPVKCHVHAEEVENVARSIAEHSGELKPDLIVMCTHGRSGLVELFFGSIARKVISLAATPLLLIHPSEKEPAPPFRCSRILVPLDADTSHEEGFFAALDLARPCGASLSLIMAVPTFGSLTAEWAASGKLLPGATGELLDMAEQDAGEYLSRRVREAMEREIPSEGTVLRGDPAEIIIAEAEKKDAGLVVMGTHGRPGFDSFWSGSVAAKVMFHLLRPMLLVPVKN